MTQEQILEKRLAELQAKERAEQERVAKGETLAPQRKAVEEAAAALKRKEAGDASLAQARKAEQEARQEADRILAAKIAAKANAAKFPEQVAALESKRAELLYRQGLLELRLFHADSPFRRQAWNDAEVAKQRRALEEAEREAREHPSPEATAAAKEAAAAVAARRELEGRVSADPKVAGAEAKVRELAAASREESARDPRLAAIQNAKQALEEARSAALAKTAEAKPLLDEQAGLDAKHKQAADEARANELMLEAVCESVAPQVRETAQAEKAQSSWEKLLQSAALAQFREKHAEACKQYDATFQKLIAPNETYAQLGKQIQRKEEEYKDSRRRALAVASIEALRSMRKQLAEQDGELADLRRRQREIRIREPELDKCWKARASAEGEWHRQARRQSGGEELWEAARRTAMEQKRALREKAAETALGKLVSEEARNLGEREAGFRFGQAVLRYQLHGNRSPLASAVERDGEVAKKRESLAALQDDLRNRPSPAAALAAKKAEEAGQERKAAVEEAEKAADFGPVREKARAAEAALRKAQANDPKRKAVEAAKAKYEEKLGAAVAALDQAKPLAAELERVTKELEESAAQAKKLRDEQAGLRRATEQGDDPEVAAAKKKVEQSQKAAKDAEKKAGLSQLSQQLDAARKALAAKQKELIAADPACKAVREEIAAVERDLKALRKPPAPKPPR